jgi:hypothetical protein
VDAGSHRVIFSFRPASVWIGASTSLVVLVLLVGTAAYGCVCTWGQGRPRRTRAQDEPTLRA